MTDRRTLLLKICDGTIELSIRLLVKISCLLAGYVTALAFHRNVADLTGTLIFAFGTFGAFAVLRPIAYHLYPELKRSDLRNAKRRLNPATLAALGISVFVLVIFMANVWFGVALLSMLAAGALVAVALAVYHRKATLIR